MSRVRVLKNEMKVSFPAIAANEALARSVTAVFAAQIDPAVDKLAELKTAVSEAVTNCVVHGYRGREAGLVELQMRIYEDKLVEIRIRDKGCGIENVAQAMEPMYTTAPEEERAGLGFAVMESFCSKIKVHSRPGKGTSVTLFKDFGASADT